MNNSGQNTYPHAPAAPQTYAPGQTYTPPQQLPAAWPPHPHSGHPAQYTSSAPIAASTHREILVPQRPFSRSKLPLIASIAVAIGSCALALFVLADRDGDTPAASTSQPTAVDTSTAASAPQRVSGVLNSVSGRNVLVQTPAGMVVLTRTKDTTGAPIAELSAAAASGTKVNATYRTDSADKVATSLTIAKDPTVALPTSEGLVTAVSKTSITLRSATGPITMEIRANDSAAMDERHLREHMDSGAPIRISHEQAGSQRYAVSYVDAG